MEYFLIHRKEKRSLRYFGMFCEVPVTDVDTQRWCSVFQIAVWRIVEQDFEKIHMRFFIKRVD